MNLKRILLFVIIFSIFITVCSAVDIDKDVILQTDGSQCDYYIATGFNHTEVTIYPTALYIGNNISTYPSSGWINMSMENLLNTTHIYFSNNVTASNISIINGFADFLISRGNIYSLHYQLNDTVYQYNTSSDITHTEIVFTSIPAGSWYVTWSGYAPPVLYSPNNESVIYSSYPPLTYDITLDWQYTGAPQYRLVTSTNEHFTIIYSDIMVSDSESTQSFMTGDEYWWRVYSYDGTTYSDSSDIFSFNLTGNSTLSGSAIEGVVYSDISGTHTALSGVEVLIGNTTWSNTAITGSNGYYVFAGVSAGELYNLQAKKDLYLDSSVALVNATSDPVTQNFYLLPDRTSEEWRHYVKFVVWGISGYYENIEVKVYENSGVTAIYTAKTGSDGAATFIMDRNKEYKVTFINATQGIDREMVLYPKNEEYLIFVSSTGSWTEHEDPQYDVIDIDVSTEVINSTHAYINVSYNDSMNETTSWTCYLNQSNSSTPHTQDNIQSTSNTTSTWTHSFVVSEYKGESYWINIGGVHTTYGVIDEQFSVAFPTEVGFDGIPDKAWLYVAILFMLFTGGMFGASTVQIGALIVCVEGWIFWSFGWFAPIDNGGIIAVGLGVATTIALIANINHHNKKEGFE